MKVQFKIKDVLMENIKMQNILILKLNIKNQLKNTGIINKISNLIKNKNNKQKDDDDKCDFLRYFSKFKF